MKAWIVFRCVFDRYSFDKQRWKENKTLMTVPASCIEFMGDNDSEIYLFRTRREARKEIRKFWHRQAVWGKAVLFKVRVRGG